MMLKSIRFNIYLYFLVTHFSLGCIREVSTNGVLTSGTRPAQIGRESVCPSVVARVRHHLGSRVSQHIRPSCPRGNNLFSRLAERLRGFIDRDEDLKQKPECFQQALRLVAFESKEFPTICQPYLDFVKKAEAEPSEPMCGEIGSESTPREVSPRLEDAIQACADALSELSLRKKTARKQLTIDEALKLHEKGKIGFHVTPSQYLNFIQTVGLDPRLGGHWGLADSYRTTPSIGARNREYKLPVSGYTHVTKNPIEAAERADIYNFASANAQVIAVRFDENIKSPPDDEMGLYDYKTDQWIWSEDLVVIPASKRGEFGILDPTAARLSRIKAASQKIVPSKAAQSIDPSLIKFSQDSVSGAREITQSLAQRGWLDSLGYIDIVKISDGSLITADNTRLLGASRAGIFVKGIVHDENEPLTSKMAKRFTTPGDGTPRTWGDAVKFRINCGKKNYRSQFPTGAYIVGSRD